MVMQGFHFQSVTDVILHFVTHNLRGTLVHNEFVLSRLSVAAESLNGTDLEVALKFNEYLL